MPKKSHRVASRQAAVSKERKRKKRAQAASRHPISAGTPASAPAVPPTAATPEPAAAPAVTQPAPAPRQAAPRYQYVITDLRKTALLAGAMLVILIVLAFVLG